MPDAPLTGPEAIYHALGRMDMEKLEDKARDDLKSGATTRRRPAVKMLHVLEGLKKNDLQPKDLTVSKVPVIPPIFRPFSLAGDTFIPGDANELYKDLLNYRKVFEDLRGELGEEGARDSANNLYGAVKAVYGYGDAINPKSKQRGVSGFLQQLIGKGSGPKFCYDSETEILTRDGWVKFPELKEGVEVGTMNPTSMQFEWQTPTDYLHEDYEGPMVHFKSGKRVDLLVTPNHRMWFSREDGWTTEPACNLKHEKGDIVWQLVPEGAPGMQEEFHIQKGGPKAGSVDYKGTIHCCTVDNTLLVVRRKGKPIVSGNSTFQRRLFSKTMDSVGRGVITAGPELDMDEIGIPETMAWKLYGPYVQRRLVQSGMSSLGALDHLTDKTDFARKALDREMGERPVVYSRAPAWHKYNTIAGWAKLTEGDHIETNPYFTTGAGADNDGDCQLSCVLILISHTENKSLNKCLTASRVSDIAALAMKDKNIIPAFSTTTHSLYFVDLEDMPAGNLVNQVEGKNGPIDFFETLPGTKVIAFDEKTNKPVWAEASHYSVHKQREIEVVTLSTGRQIITDDDPRAVYGLDPSAEGFDLQRFTPTEALEKKVVVPCLKNSGPVCEDLESLKEVQIGDLTVPLDWNFGYLMGALCGDGWWDKRLYEMNGSTRCVYISDLREQVSERVYEILCSVFGKVTRRRKEMKKTEDNGRYGDTVKHTYYLDNYSTEFCEFLSLWMKGEASKETSGSGNKRLPGFFVGAPKAFKEGLLNGLVDTDGTCAVTNGKKKPQLVIAVTSTSVRMINDLKYLCLSLGIQATVSFSKTTTRGNTSWICGISSVDAKRANIFHNLANDYKKKNFLETEVTLKGTSLKFDKCPVPSHIRQLISRDVVVPQMLPGERDSGTPESLYKKHAQNMSSTLHKTAKEKIASRPFFFQLKGFLEHLESTRQSLITQAVEDLRKGDVNTPEERVEMWREAIIAVAPKKGDLELYKKGLNMRSRTGNPFQNGYYGAAPQEDLANWIEQNRHSYTPAIHTPEFQYWWDNFVMNEDITWAAVTSVEKTGQKEDGYDLTVPGYETFASADGIILSNTVNVHLPSMKESVEEAKNLLMPSKMVMSIKQPEHIVPALKHEQILGLYGAKHRPAKNFHQFGTEEEALTAIKGGQVSLQDEVEITGMPKLASEVAPTNIIEQLLEAKDASDVGMYTKKNRILRKLVDAYPDQFTIDSREGPILGVTHKPSGFRMHTKATAMPPSFLMSTTAPEETPIEEPELAQV